MKLENIYTIVKRNETSNGGIICFRIRGKLAIFRQPMSSKTVSILTQSITG